METVVHHAKVYLRRNVFAQAVLIRDDRIAAAGSNVDMLSLASPRASLIDAGEGLLLPGFYDCHIHLSDLGGRVRKIDLRGAASLEDLVAQCRQKVDALNPAEREVVSGDGYNQEHFSGEKRFPNRFDLDKVSSRSAVVISRVCGHVVSCNSRALELAGLSSAESLKQGKAAACDPSLIETDSAGLPTGVFREGAAFLVRNLSPGPRGILKQADLEYAVKSALSWGVTAAASYDINGPDFDEILAAYTGVMQNTPMRIVLQCGIARDTKNLACYLERGLKTGQALFDPWIKMGPLKLFADGSLGSRTAWLRRPYCDAPHTSGCPAEEPAALAALFQRAHAGGLQIVIHAIGDAALDAVLSGFEGLTAPGSNPLRHGALHCQITDPPLLERMKRNDILALVQPAFLREDRHIVQSRVGEALAASSYAWGTMDRLGIHTAYGTDCPVEPVNPLIGIACAVHREGGFFPDECVDIFTAVDAYTQGTAYANFDESRLGRIKPGYYADLTLLDQDIFTLPPPEIPSAKVRWTMTGGKIVYES